MTMLSEHALYPDSLRRLVERHYRHRGKVDRVAIAHNLLGDPNFREVFFTNGTCASFCLGYDETFWVRNERRRRQVVP